MLLPLSLLLLLPLICSQPNIPHQKTLDLFAILPSQSTLTTQESRIAHVTFNTAGSVKGFRKCVKKIQTESWISAKTKDLQPPLAQFNYTLVTVFELFSQLDFFLDRLRKLPKTVFPPRSLPQATCADSSSFFHDLPLTALRSVCTHIAARLHEPTNNSALYPNYIDLGNTWIDSLMMHLNNINLAFFQVYKLLYELQYRSFPEHLTFLLTNCTGKSDSKGEPSLVKAEILACTSTQLNVTCAIQVSAYFSEVNVNPIKPIAYNGLSATLPFHNSALVHGMNSVVDLDGCFSITTKHLYCAQQNFQIFPCIAAAHNGQIKEILKTCSFAKPQKIQHLPLQLADHSFLVDYCSGLGKFKVNNITITNKPFVVLGGTLSFTALTTSIVYIAGGKAEIAISKFSADEITLMKNSITGRDIVQQNLDIIIVASITYVLYSLTLLSCLLAILLTKHCLSAKKHVQAYNIPASQNRPASSSAARRQLRQIIAENRLQ